METKECYYRLATSVHCSQKITYVLVLFHDEVLSASLLRQQHLAPFAISNNSNTVSRKEFAGLMETVAFPFLIKAFSSAQ